MSRAELHKCHTVEDWMKHIQEADQLTKDIFLKGPYDVLYDALNHPYQDCYDAIKEFGELCFKSGYEQAEKDLALTPIDIHTIAKIIYSMENKKWEYRHADVDLSLAEEILKKFNETRK